MTSKDSYTCSHQTRSQGYKYTKNAFAAGVNVFPPLGGANNAPPNHSWIWELTSRRVKEEKTEGNDWRWKEEKGYGSGYGIDYLLLSVCFNFVSSRCSFR